MLLAELLGGSLGDHVDVSLHQVASCAELIPSDIGSWWVTRSVGKPHRMERHRMQRHRMRRHRNTETQRHPQKHRDNADSR